MLSISESTIERETSDSMNETRSGFTCKRCGYCCLYLGHYLTQDEVDWEKVVDHIIEKYHGLLKLRCNCGCGEVTYHLIKSVDDLPFPELDYARCPFLKRERDAKGRFTSKYYCDIHEFKPKICREFPFNHENPKDKFPNCPGFD